MSDTTPAPQPAAGTLAERIRQLPALHVETTEARYPHASGDAYRAGHRDARLAAARLAEAELLTAALAEARDDLQEFRIEVHGLALEPEMCAAGDEPYIVLRKVYRAMEAARAEAERGRLAVAVMDAADAIVSAFARGESMRAAEEAHTAACDAYHAARPAQGEGQAEKGNHDATKR